MKRFALVTVVIIASFLSGWWYGKSRVAASLPQPVSSESEQSLRSSSCRMLIDNSLAELPASLPLSRPEVESALINSAPLAIKSEGPDKEWAQQTANRLLHDLRQAPECAYDMKILEE